MKFTKLFRMSVSGEIEISRKNSKIFRYEKRPDFGPLLGHHHKEILRTEERHGTYPFDDYPLDRPRMP